MTVLHPKSQPIGKKVWALVSSISVWKLLLIPALDAQRSRRELTSTSGQDERSCVKLFLIVITVYGRKCNG
jgi:hypothetical protein